MWRLIRNDRPSSPRQHTMKPTAKLAAPSLIFLAAAACAPTSFAEVIDLRAEKWKRTTVANVGTGAVQHTGDDTKLGSLRDRVMNRIAALPSVSGASRVEIKTIDVRLSIPDAQLDWAAVRHVQSSPQLYDPKYAAFAPVFASLLARFSKDKTASAVFCVAVDGKHFLGNDARLFRYGPEEELVASLEAALSALEKAIQSGAATDSPACEPGWEGGQEGPP